MILLLRHETWSPRLLVAGSRLSARLDGAQPRCNAGFAILIEHGPGFEMRALFWSLLAVAALFGAPKATRLFNLATGPWSGQAIHADGSVTDMRFGLDLPTPDWVPLPPDAELAQVSQQTSNKAPGIFGSIEILTRVPLHDAKRFYTERLTRLGFAVTDEGLGTLNQAAAEYLGVAGSLVARREANGDEVRIQFRDEHGWLSRSRLVQITWRTPRPAI